MPPTFILSQDQTLQFCIDSPARTEVKPGESKIQTESVPVSGGLGKDLQQFAIFSRHRTRMQWVDKTTSQISELNRSSITKLSNIKSAVRCH